MGDSRTPDQARLARQRVIDGGRSETLFAEIHGHESTEYQKLESRFQDVVSAWTVQKQKIRNQQEEIDRMRREAGEFTSLNQSLRVGLDDAFAAV